MQIRGRTWTDNELISLKAFDTYIDKKTKVAQVTLREVIKKILLTRTCK